MRHRAQAAKGLCESGRKQNRCSPDSPGGPEMIDEVLEGVLSRLKDTRVHRRLNQYWWYVSLIRNHN